MNGHFPFDLRPDPSPRHFERECNTTGEDPSPNAVSSYGDGAERPKYRIGNESPSSKSPLFRRMTLSPVISPLRSMRVAHCGGQPLGKGIRGPGVGPASAPAGSGTAPERFENRRSRPRVAGPVPLPGLAGVDETELHSDEVAP